MPGWHLATPRNTDPLATWVSLKIMPWFIIFYGVGSNFLPGVLNFVTCGQWTIGHIRLWGVIIGLGVKRIINYFLLFMLLMGRSDVWLYLSLLSLRNYNRQLLQYRGALLGSGHCSARGTGHCSGRLSRPRLEKGKAHVTCHLGLSPGRGWRPWSTG